MKLKDIPVKKQADITTLPQENELILINTEYREPSKDAQGKAKTGGLVVRFQDRAGFEVPQKYSALSYAALVEAMTKLGYEDTDDLKSWHRYKLTAFRMGYPRYLPFKKLKQ